MLLLNASAELLVTTYHLITALHCAICISKLEVAIAGVILF